MTVNNSGLNYSSNWDIDQLVLQGVKTVTAAAGLNSYPIVAFSRFDPSVVWMTYQVAGQSYWHNTGAPGEGLTPTHSPGLDSTLNVSVAALPSLTGLSAQVNNFTAGNVNLTIRYYIDADKVTY